MELQEKGEIVEPLNADGKGMQPLEVLGGGAEDGEGRGVVGGIEIGVLKMEKSLKA